ncbi:hypothetical protein GCM10022408_21570 [Hymenobacter fastidiosus]|uniref:Uncharacterized protein n=1 Tax=Hymenobacter fastidiosus TaxID=486264 RepID=A0ABP7SB65_9BACT
MPGKRLIPGLRSEKGAGEPADRGVGGGVFGVGRKQFDTAVYRGFPVGGGRKLPRRQPALPECGRGLLYSGRQ